MATRTLRDRLNYTCNGLSGQPTAIVVIPPRSNTQTPPGSAAPPVIPIAAPPATPIAAPAGTSTPPGPPPTRYLYPSTARDRLNHTLDGLAIGPESVQPTTTATTPPGMQLPTPTAPQLPTPRIPQPPTLSGPPLAQYLDRKSVV